ncbi:MAG: carbohydrate esterase [Pseudomonadales bacterium]|nr:carbohydrate esterase [Pseudomonadales bacterium]
MMKPITLIMILVALLVLSAAALFKIRYDFNLTTLKLDLMTEAHRHEALPYRTYMPERAQEGKRPLILYLQSGAGRGDDNLGQLRQEMWRLIEVQQQYALDYMILAPQCPDGVEWNNAQSGSPPYPNLDFTRLEESERFRQLLQLVQRYIDQGIADPDRIYLVGISMGATAAWEFLYRHPDKFAAALIMNGRSDPGVAQAIAKTPIWLGHGEKDTVAPIANSTAMSSALAQHDADLVFRTFDAGHQIANVAITEESLGWILTKHKNSSWNRHD